MAVALVGQPDDFPGLVNLFEQRVGVRDAVDHRLFQQHMRPGVQAVHRLLEMQRVRRADDDGIRLDSFPASCR